MWIFILPMYHILFSQYNLRMKNIQGSPVWARYSCFSWVPSLTKVLHLILLCCVQYRVILYHDISWIYNMYRHWYIRKPTTWALIYSGSKIQLEITVCRPKYQVPGQLYGTNSLTGEWFVDMCSGCQIEFAVAVGTFLFYISLASLDSLNRRDA